MQLLHFSTVLSNVAGEDDAALVFRVLTSVHAVRSITGMTAERFEQVKVWYDQALVGEVLKLGSDPDNPTDVLVCLKDREPIVSRLVSREVVQYEVCVEREKPKRRKR